MNEIVVRPVQSEDREAILALERKVWGKRGVGSIPHETFDRWLTTYPQGFLAAFQAGTLCGYSYSELVYFEPNLIGTSDWERLVLTGHSVSHHDPHGNTLFGVSIATDPPGAGAGKLLLERTMQLGVETGDKYLITLSRMAGLRRYFESLKALGNSFQSESTMVLAVYYAILSMRLVEGTLSPAYAAIPIPADLPPVTERDEVLCRFARLTKMALYDVMPSSFTDPESMNCAALMVHEFRKVG